MSEQRTSRVIIFVLLVFLLVAGGAIATLLYYYSKTLNAYRLLSAKYAGLLAKGTSEDLNLILPTWATLIENLSPNLLASIVGTFFAVFLGTLIIRKVIKEKDESEFIGKLKGAMGAPVNVLQAPDLSRMENTLEQMVGKWPQLNPTDVCKNSYECIPEVRQIKNQLDQLDRERTTKPYYSLLKDFMTSRLEHLGKHLDIPHCSWVLVKYYDSEAIKKELDLMTEADLAYDIISESIFTHSDKASGSIKALTILPFIHWWLTPVGLKYLQSQRKTADKKITVDRLFFFPSGIISSLFPKLKTADGGKLEVTENTDVKKDELNYIKKLLYFQHCLGINVKLLSPDIVSEKTMRQTGHTELTDIAKQWTSCDFAILAADGEQCMIEIQAFDSVKPTTFLLAKDGQVHFNTSAISIQLEKYDKLYAMGIDLSSLIASDKSECDDLCAAIADITNLPEAIESIHKLLIIEGRY